MGYIVGHNRDRDSYQVPLALAEAGQLDYFVTDYYEGKGMSIPSLQHRKAEGIKPANVVQSHRAFAAQMPYEVRRRVQKSVDFPSAFVEKNLGKTIARVAARNIESDLLLYSGSALWAFRGPSKGKRILFQYHPSPAFIAETLSNIDELAQVRPWQQEAEVLDPGMQEIHAAEVALADSAICASTFTKTGLVQQGMNPEKITIAPYGGPRAKTSLEVAPSNKVQFLFVGQGVARKGLHILIEAWRQASLKNSELTIIASRLDPEIEAFAANLPNCTLVGRVSDEELSCHMANADTFVLPSLVEGYGLVLAESLAHGCRLIASNHTGITDMDLPAEVGTTVQAGEVQSLVDALKQGEDTAEKSRSYQELALEAANRLSWENFRNIIRQAAGAGL